MTDKPTPKLPEELEKKLLTEVSHCCADVKSGYSFEVQPVFDVVAQALSDQKQQLIEKIEKNKEDYGWGANADEIIKLLQEEEV